MLIEPAAVDARVPLLLRWLSSSAPHPFRDQQNALHRLDNETDTESTGLDGGPPDCEAPAIANISQLHRGLFTPRASAMPPSDRANAMKKFAGGFTEVKVRQDTSAVVFTFVRARCVGITIRWVSTVSTSARMLRAPAATSASTRSASSVRYTPAR
jgi:hypothetical protein